MLLLDFWNVWNMYVRKCKRIRELYPWKLLYRDVVKTQSNIYDGVFSENDWRLLAVNYFRKNVPS